jgi:hypothetical protein
MLKPESLGGRGMACPECGGALELKDLFGLSAAFDEDAPPELSLDDLMQSEAQLAGEPARTKQPSTARTRAPEPKADGQAESALDWMKKNRKR